MKSFVFFSSESDFHTVYTRSSELLKEFINCRLDIFSMGFRLLYRVTPTKDETSETIVRNLFSPFFYIKHVQKCQFKSVGKRRG